MIEKAQIEKLLRMNGVEVTSPDEEIRSILLQARWHEKDVETAMLILRENTTSHETHVDSLRKMFVSDEKLKPETISALLGIDILVPKGKLDTKRKSMNQGMSFGQVLAIAFFSAVLACVFVFGSMWYLQVGVFHIAL